MPRERVESGRSRTSGLAPGGPHRGETALAKPGSRKRRTSASPAAQRQLRHEEQLRLSQRMEMIGRLASGLAHDFNNMLTAILGQCNLLLRRLSQEDPSRRGIEEINKACNRAAALTHQLLAYSRRQILEPRVLDLNASVKTMAPMLKPLIGEDVELIPMLQSDLGHIKADPSQVEQVVMNLVVNARDSMPKGGRVVIETSNTVLDKTFAKAHIPMQPGHYVMLAVSDTGSGMDAETQKRIFEPFFTTKELGKGTGLGLATVYGIVKQSGGFIWVYSELGIGSTFKIYLPRVEEEAEQEVAKEPSIVRTHGSETILLVEDDDIVRSTARKFLEMDGYTVLEARAGPEALDIVRRHKHPIHLLLTDVVMPLMSGRQLAESVASIHPGIRVLYMSGYTDGVIAHHGVLDPGVAYLQKPFTADSLARKVRETLDPRPARGPSGAAEEA